MPINGYFKNHPEQILGTLSRKDTLYAEGYSVVSNGDLAERLKEAVERLPQFEQLQSPAQQPNPPPVTPAFVLPPPDRHISEGSFFVKDGRIHQVVDGNSVPVVYGGGEIWANGAWSVGGWVRLIELRDLARRVLQSQNEGWPDNARQDARKQLNAAYNRFHSAFGAINKTTSFGGQGGHHNPSDAEPREVQEDPDAMLVMALEEYDEQTGDAKKAPICSRDVVGKTPPITCVATAEEGLLVSLNQRGVVDLPLHRAALRQTGRRRW